MTASPPTKPGRIFISYRRDETAYPAGWLYDRLADHYGGGQVFKDVDSIELGDDFVEVITRAVGSCDVLLALIGEDWLTITDAQAAVASTTRTTSSGWRSRPPWRATSASSRSWSMGPGCLPPKSCRTACPSWRAGRPWS